LTKHEKYSLINALTCDTSKLKPSEKALKRRQKGDEKKL